MIELKNLSKIYDNGKTRVDAARICSKKSLLYVIVCHRLFGTRS